MRLPCRWSLEGTEMKITDIRTAIIAANFPWNLIRVYTDSGLVGLGEAYWGPGVTLLVESKSLCLIW